MGIKEDLVNRIEELRDKNSDLHMENDNLTVGIVLLAVIMIFLVLFAISGFTKSSSIKTLDLEDVLMRYHVLKYYPEFEGCIIKFDYCAINNFFSCDTGIKIYCNQGEELMPKDGLVPVDNLEEKLPDEILMLEGIKLKDIYRDWKQEGFK